MRSLGPVPGHPLFVYGTLLDPAFVSRLLERPVQPVDASLLDFELLHLDGWPYPVLFEAPGEVVRGGLYRDLGPDQYVRLDHYEGVHEGLYHRSLVRVVAATATGAKGSPEPAFVYLVTEKTLRRHDAL